MNGTTEDHSPLAKAVTELESIKGRRYPLAWKQLERLNAVNAVAQEMAEALQACWMEDDNGVTFTDLTRAALGAYEKAVNA